MLLLLLMFCSPHELTFNSEISQRPFQLFADCTERIKLVASLNTEGSLGMVPAKSKHSAVDAFHIFDGKVYVGLDRLLCFQVINGQVVTAAAKDGAGCARIAGFDEKLGIRFSDGNALSVADGKVVLRPDPVLRLVPSIATNIDIRSIRVPVRFNLHSRDGCVVYSPRLPFSIRALPREACHDSSSTDRDWVLDPAGGRISPSSAPQLCLTFEPSRENEKSVHLARRDLSNDLQSLAFWQHSDGTVRVFTTYRSVGPFSLEADVFRGGRVMFRFGRSLVPSHQRFTLANIRIVQPSSISG